MAVEKLGGECADRLAKGMRAARETPSQDLAAWRSNRHPGPSTACKAGAYMRRVKSGRIKAAWFAPLGFRSEVSLLRDAVRRRTLSNLYAVAARSSCTMIPLAAGEAQEDGTILRIGMSSQTPASVRPPGSTRTVSPGTDEDQAFLSTAPSITTPALTYFHKAMSSLRASATMVCFFKRPSFCFTRSLNHKVSAEPG
jgi:hypothetical protein